MQTKAYISKYAKYLVTKDFDDAMIEAARVGHIDIIKLLISKGARNFDDAITEASALGRMDIIELLKKAKEKYSDYQ